MVGVEAEAEVEVGLDLGPAEDLSAICPRGRDPDGCLASEEDSAEGSDGRATPTSAPASRGFQDGGGLTQVHTGSPVSDMVILGTGIPAMNNPTQPIRSTHTRDISKQTKRRSNKCGGLVSAGVEVGAGDGCGT